MSLLYECIHTIISGIPNHNAAMQVSRCNVSSWYDVTMKLKYWPEENKRFLQIREKYILGQNMIVQEMYMELLFAHCLTLCIAGSYSW